MEGTNGSLFIIALCAGSQGGTISRIETVHKKETTNNRLAQGLLFNYEVSPKPQGDVTGLWQCID